MPRYVLRKGGDELLRPYISGTPEPSTLTSNPLLARSACVSRTSKRALEIRGLGDFAQGAAHDLRARGGGLGELDGGLALGRRADDVHAVRAVLLDGGGDLAQAIDDLLLDLRGSCRGRGSAPCGCRCCRAVAPLVGLGRHFLAHRPGSCRGGSPACRDSFMLDRQRTVGVRDVGAQRADADRVFLYR